MLNIKMLWIFLKEKLNINLIFHSNLKKNYRKLQDLFLWVKVWVQKERPQKEFYRSNNKKNLSKSSRLKNRKSSLHHLLKSSNLNEPIMILSYKKIIINYFIYFIFIWWSIMTVFLMLCWNLHEKLINFLKMIIIKFCFL